MSYSLGDVYITGSNNVFTTFLSKFNSYMTAANGVNGCVATLIKDCSSSNSYFYSTSTEYDSDKYVDIGFSTYGIKLSNQAPKTTDDDLIRPILAF